ncbi:hypothetical protein FKM82_010814 [Ascaphus truei]|uniref:centromere protein W n=1 Tax=Ascaphus truei TaxID=8439 RepID=UPI003F5982E9
MKRSAPRRAIKSIVKKHKTELCTGTNSDLLVHLSCLLFLHKLAEEARTKAFEDKSSTIKPVYVRAVAKVVLKQCRG